MRQLNKDHSSVESMRLCTSYKMGVLASAAVLGLSWFMMSQDFADIGTPTIFLIAFLLLSVSWGFILKSTLVGFKSDRIDEGLAMVQSEAQTVLSCLADEFQKQFEFTAEEMRQTQDLLRDAVDHLVASFTSIYGNAHIQHDLAMALTRGAGAGGDQEPQDAQANIKAFLMDMSKVMSSFVERTVDTTNIAGNALTGLMKDIAQHVDGVVLILEDIQRSHQALDSLGETAESQVAIEQRQALSSAVASGCRQIEAHMAGVRASVESVEQHICDLANADVSIAEQSNRRAQLMLSEMDELNEETAKSIEKVAMISSQLELDINTAIRTLQFQDLTTQLIDHATHRIAAMNSALSDIRPVPGEKHGDWVKYVDYLQKQKESIRHKVANLDEYKSKPVAQQHMDTGEIELF